MQSDAQVTASTRHSSWRVEREADSVRSRSTPEARRFIRRNIPNHRLHVVELPIFGTRSSFAAHAISARRASSIHPRCAGATSGTTRSSPDRRPLTFLPPTSGKRYRGTADAVFQNSELLESDDAEFVLILSGDHIYHMDYRGFLRQHIETDADLTIATVEHPVSDASHFGVVEVDRNFNVTGFEEKPASPRPLPSRTSMALVSMGIYVFKKKMLLESLRHFYEIDQGDDFGHDIIPSLIHTGRTYAYDFRDEVGIRHATGATSGRLMGITLQAWTSSNPMRRSIRLRAAGPRNLQDIRLSTGAQKQSFLKAQTLIVRSHEACCRRAFTWNRA